ncbi:MAG: tryptophan synthase subunit alpha [Simkaniaceae bacterium]
MNRIDTAFQHSKQFIGYLTAGDRGKTFTIDAALALIEGGVTCLEIGVPFSDPMADGPVIQRAMKRALEQNTTIADCFEIISAIRKQSQVPIILFSYYNPIFQYGKEFYKDLKEAGADGLLIVDLPFFEAQEILTLSKENALHQIFLSSPSTTEESLQEINQKGSGFIYYASRKGTTGMQEKFPSDFQEKLQKIKQNSQLPLVTGFGISTAAMAAKALQICDGFVVGSHFVSAIENNCTYEELKEIARKMKPEVICY